MSKWSRLDNAKAVSPDARDLRGIVRRMAVRFTDQVLWQLTGHRFEGGYVETVETEAFTGIGFYSRPPEGSKTAEGILVRIGDAAHTALIAVRDEAVRALWAAILDANPNVAAMFNTLAGVIVTHEGKVEARSLAGVAVALAKASELQALASAFYGHAHPSNGAGPIPTFDPPDPPGDPLVNPGQPGTTVLKGQ